MSYRSKIRQLRERRKRLTRIRLTAWDKWLAIFIVMLSLLAIVVGGWLGITHHD